VISSETNQMAPEIDAIVGPGMRCSKTEQGHLIR
jgi:hypothetical protein